MVFMANYNIEPENNIRLDDFSSNFFLNVQFISPIKILYIYGRDANLPIDWRLMCEILTKQTEFSLYELEAKLKN